MRKLAPTTELEYGERSEPFHWLADGRAWRVYGVSLIVPPLAGYLRKIRALHRARVQRNLHETTQEGVSHHVAVDRLPMGQALREDGTSRTFEIPPHLDMTLDTSKTLSP